MKSMIPVSWHKLPKKEKDSIIDYLKQMLDRECTEKARRMYETFFKMAAIVLKEQNGFSKTKLMAFFAGMQSELTTEKKIIGVARQQALEAEKTGSEVIPDVTNSQDMYLRKKIKAYLGDEEFVERFFDILMPILFDD